MLEVYAVKHKDDFVRAASRSGGIFTAISDQILKNGVVYGCILDKKYEVYHIRATSSNERNKMRGSKYVQSDLGNSFRLIKNDLENGLHVLFTGTSCQVAGLKSFLGKDFENLLCIDIVCHGVPSPLIWKSYIDWIGNVDRFNFRDKSKFGWRDHVESFVIRNKTKYSTVWKNIFYGHQCLRPCCYECHYKSISHPGDITIADYWGIEKAAPEFDDNKGVSLVLINSIKGKEWFELTKDCIEFKETKLEDSMQPPLISPFDAPKNRAEFWQDYFNNDFSFIAKKYGGKNLKTNLKQFIKNIIRNG